jgi:hypothetical protein
MIGAGYQPCSWTIPSLPGIVPNGRMVSFPDKCKSQIGPIACMNYLALSILDFHRPIFPHAS